MYGTVARLKVKPGMQAEVAAWGRNWAATRKAIVPGAVGGYIYQMDSDPDAMILVAVFADKQSYHANAQDPGEEKEYQRLRALLTEDPIWGDGDIVWTF